MSVYIIQLLWYNNYSKGNGNPKTERIFKMKVTTYVINEGQTTQYYGLKDADENMVLYSAPNNWKTEKGALNWARKHGFEIA